MIVLPTRFYVLNKKRQADWKMTTFLLQACLFNRETRVQTWKKILALFFYFTMYTQKEYIFPLPRNAFPREGTGVKTDFFFREKVSLSAVVGKKDGCLTDRSSCLPERSEGRQRREVRQSFRPETKERETFSRKRKRSDRTISLPGKRFLSRGMHFLS